MRCPDDRCGATTRPFADRRFWHATAFTVLALAACSSAGGTSDPSAPAGMRTAVVDRITADKPEWQRLAHRLRRDMIAELKGERAFDVVDKAVPALAGPDLIRVDGHVDAVDPGSDFISTLTGDVGWGGAALRVTFRILSRDGQVFAEFTEEVTASRPLAEATVVGSVFRPQFDPLYADALADTLAADAAGTVAQWAAEEGGLRTTGGPGGVGYP